MGAACSWRTLKESNLKFDFTRTLTTVPTNHSREYNQRWFSLLLNYIQLKIKHILLYTLSLRLFHIIAFSLVFLWLHLLHNLIIIFLNFFLKHYSYYSYNILIVKKCFIFDFSLFLFSYFSKYLNVFKMCACYHE